MCASQTHPPAILLRPTRADRKSLLLGTALASTLLIGALLAPSPASAVVTCPAVAFPPPGPIGILNPGDNIACFNIFDRYNNGGAVIGLATNGAGEDILLRNSGDLVNVSAFAALGIFAYTSATGSPISIVNTGDLTIDAASIAFGIRALADDANSPISIVNGGDIVATGNTYRAYGILARAEDDDSPIDIRNRGDIVVTAVGGGFSAFGIRARADGAGSPISIVNSGDIVATAYTYRAYGIRAHSYDDGSAIEVRNSGSIAAFAGSDEVYGIRARSDGAASPLTLVNRGDIAVSGAVFADGISVATAGDDSSLNAVNSGDIEVIAADSGFGIQLTTISDNSPLKLENVGDIAVTARDLSGFGIGATAQGSNSPLVIENSGDIAVEAEGFAFGIDANSPFGINNPFRIVNSGQLAVTSIEGTATGITVETEGESPIEIVNSGDIAAIADLFARGIDAETADGANSPIMIRNSGDIVATAVDGIFFSGAAYGIRASTEYAGSLIDIVNSGDIEATAGAGLGLAGGIFARTYEDISSIQVLNSGSLAVRAANFGYGISGTTHGNTSPLAILNRGDMMVEGHAGSGTAIRAFTYGRSSQVAIENEGTLAVASIGAVAFGMNTYSAGLNSPINILNNGDITASGAVSSYGISSVTVGNASPIAIINTAKITADTFGIYAATSGMASPIAIFNAGVIDPEVGISAVTSDPDSPITINNAGAAYGDLVGIRASSPADTTIINSGAISAGSLLAIASYGPGDTKIFNTGVITGFIKLDADDTMVNQQGGTFDAKLTSDFGPGEDLFNNEGVVHAVALGANQPSIVNLERFENSGVISTQDGDVGDVFTITGTDLQFVASGKSTIAVDAFLGPTGATADQVILDGDVTGRTKVLVNNTRAEGGVFNPKGIPFVHVNGQVSSNAFFMPQPFDSGLFDWDAFFVPTGSGFFELRSFPGGGSHVLPQLLTAAQDVWHTTNETWFDRTADLRVLLNGGAAYGAGGGKLDAPISTAFTPGVWLKGSGTWLEQQDSASTSAYGRTYRYNLNRDLDVWNLEGGVDFGKKGVLAEGDALVFGLLGGAILGRLDYDQLIRQFDIEGGEVGGYVTYLNGGLFVDTLAKVDFLEFDANGAPGLPGTLDSTSWGFRTDAGYRFGGFRRGPFIEPLATIAVVWSEIDDFTLGGNAVKFDDEANVRGRLGLRVGTSREVWQGIVAEPFVIGSVWGNLSGDNKATVTSFGTKFGPFIDEPDDVWGVVSTGVNFFSPGASTSLFAKLDVTFGEDTEGVSARGGMRYNW